MEENEKQNGLSPNDAAPEKKTDGNVSLDKIPTDADPEVISGAPTEEVPDMPAGNKKGSGDSEIPPEYAAALAKDVPEVPTVTQKDLEQQVRAGLNRRVAMAVVFIGAILITALLTFYLTSIYYDRNSLSKRKSGELYSSVKDAQDGMRDLAVLAYLLDQNAYYAYDYDKELIMQALMKAYVAYSGDKYASFYTAAEYAAQQKTSAGVAQEGIGVTSLQEAAKVDGVTVGTFRIVDFTDGSPAKAAGLALDDRILAVKTTDGWLTVKDPTPVNERFSAFLESLASAASAGEWQTDVRVEDGVIFVRVGDEWKSFAYADSAAVTQNNNACLAAIRGEAGTDVTLRVLRGNEVFEITVTRGASTTHSVLSAMSVTDPHVGIVTILKYDQTTPKQFKAAMESLIGQGAERFVLDLRDNPGGQVYSVSTILSYFLNRNDLILTKVDRDGKVIDRNGTVLAEEEVSGVYAITREEIGMYREYPLALVVNGNTASAAEIMTSVLRDYDLATVVGEKTFGKGIMQTTESGLLNRFGVSGAVTFTFCSFLPPSGESFHGIGISPDEGWEVSLPEEAEAISRYIRPETDDIQLLEAIRAVNER